MKIKTIITMEGTGQAMDDLMFLGFDKVSMERRCDDNGNNVVDVFAETTLWELVEEPTIGYEKEGTEDGNN